MLWQRCALKPIVLVLCSAVHAQTHHGQQGQHQIAPNHGGSVHPGQGQHGHGMMTEEHMWNQWAQEQMYLNQIMGGSHGSRNRSQSSSGRSGGSKSSSSQSSPSLPNGNAKPSTESRPHNGSHEKSATKKAEHNPAASKQKLERSAAKHLSQARRPSDQSVISLLRTTHSRLNEADHDYDGHRVRSMEHIAGALRDLGSSTPVGSVSLSSAGNLSQSRSDEILRTALFQLKNTETSLGTGTDRSERHHRAHRRRHSRDHRARKCTPHSLRRPKIKFINKSRESGHV